jgi:formylmethanofuran:tetrahydromethanopterin formyltransferase
MRHFFTSSPIAPRPNGVGALPAVAGLITPPSGGLVAAAGSLRTVSGTVDLTAIATAANQRLAAALRTEKEPGWQRFGMFEFAAAAM